MLNGYIVRETEAAVAFVAAADASKAGVKPLWIPRKKIVATVELDLTSRTIVTGQDGERVGTPVNLDVDTVFLAKIGLAA